jgi:hypothetical protein
MQADDSAVFAVLNTLLHGATEDVMRILEAKADPNGATAVCHHAYLPAPL